ncbi:precorrin-2 C(20)-methyltransferase [Aliiruegeria sabulilitoris]|uniref:precorrin-2 C(20)-methyltransferase n=1 Tax=Aliiruegeria sabulilitoris TaxID=1510458 RepID=UPI00082FF223|nr:precorrin-2 C(20)-methyltransferase [Aliiruegeria sabulilitoris]NDR59052.1 precorrin-2 C(20)-methyltransferase [Pseudoruegeria sp. M32A2M]
MSGTLYGLGVGPGDPELLTLKAHRLLSAAGVVAYPAPDSGDSFARAIVADYIPEGAREIPIVIPMRVERFPAQDVYDAAAETIAAALEAGEDVVVLCEGDPFFYGSFMYLFSRLAERFPTEIVPGVSSLGAVTAVARQPLIARDEVLTVVPATLEEAELEKHLREANAAAIMKIGRHFARTRAVLERLGMAERAVFVSHASLPQQVVCPLAEAPEKAPYFSMILVPGRDAHV